MVGSTIKKKMGVGREELTEVGQDKGSIRTGWGKED